MYARPAKYNEQKLRFTVIIKHWMPICAGVMMSSVVMLWVYMYVCALTSRRQTCAPSPRSWACAELGRSQQCATASVRRIVSTARDRRECCAPCCHQTPLHSGSRKRTQRRWVVGRRWHDECPSSDACKREGNVRKCRAPAPSIPSKLRVMCVCQIAICF